METYDVILKDCNFFSKLEELLNKWISQNKVKNSWATNIPS